MRSTTRSFPLHWNLPCPSYSRPTFCFCWHGVCPPFIPSLQEISQILFLGKSHSLKVIKQGSKSKNQPQGSFHLFHLGRWNYQTDYNQCLFFLCLKQNTWNKHVGKPEKDLQEPNKNQAELIEKQWILDKRNSMSNSQIHPPQEWSELKDVWMKVFRNWSGEQRPDGKCERPSGNLRKL